ESPLPLPADRLAEPIGCFAGGLAVVGGNRRYRDVAVDAGVEADDRDLLRLELLKQRNCCLAVERREADGGRVLVQLGLEHLQLLVDLRLVLRALEVDLHAELGGLALGAFLDGLPELVLEALRDDRDVGARDTATASRARGRTAAAGCGRGSGRRAAPGAR